PSIPPTIEEIEQALAILQIDASDMRCAYCGDTATEWDHLRPLVLQRRPTGFISEIANLVPSCGKCNQSKGNKPWRAWMLSKAKLSPTGRNLATVAERIARLEAYEKWRVPTKIDFESILGKDAWESPLIQLNLELHEPLLVEYFEPLAEPERSARALEALK